MREKAMRLFRRINVKFLVARSPEFTIREARISAFAMRKNNDRRQPQICLGFSYNWHTLDIIVRYNRPRKEKNAFCG